MSLTGGVRLALEIDDEPGGLRGTITPAGGERREFAGWLELASAIEDVLAGAREAVKPDDPNTRAGEDRP